MAITYDAGNSANWEQVWTGNFIADPAPGNVPGLERYFPIPPITIPVLFDSELIAFSSSSDSAQPHWHFAATIEQRVSTGLTVGGGSNTIASHKKIYLREITLLRYQIQFGSSYSLIVKIPYWIRDLSVICWVYTGNVNDSYDLKLDQLLAR